MSGLGERIAREAEKLVGVPFRLQGRTEASGLDCLGLVALALSRARGGRLVSTPRAYRLRNTDIADHLRFAEIADLAPARGKFEPGDIIHTRPGFGQDHLLIITAPGLHVHAHAGLRRVVQTSGQSRNPIAHHWRAN